MNGSGPRYKPTLLQPNDFFHNHDLEIMVEEKICSSMNVSGQAG